MSHVDRPTLVCLTPVRNESWILERFIRCASLWAEKIIIADQQSDDGSREIAKRFEKVTLIENTSPAYDEGARQRLLVDAARKLVPVQRRILIALDADEMLSSDFASQPQWRQMLDAAPGTVLKFDWVNILPGFDKCWIQPEQVPFGFVDDGAQHAGRAIHSTRIPTPENATVLDMGGVKALHYQFVAWERMTSKQRWYQCWERMQNPHKRPIAIYRQYQKMNGRPLEEIHPFEPKWIAGYEQAGIDMRTIDAESQTWWDRQVMSWMEEKGTDFFRKEAIWDVDWRTVARSMGCNGKSESFRDPRNAFERAVHQWLLKTQPRAAERRIRWVQRALWLAGW